MKPYTERNAEIVRLREETSMTYEAIGLLFDITRERVRQIEQRELWRKHREMQCRASSRHREIRWAHFLAQRDLP